MRGNDEDIKREDRSPARDSTAGRDASVLFDAFYDFAFPRVHRFAQRHTRSEQEAEAFCRLVLTRALTSLGGLGALENRVYREPASAAFWLFCIARQAAADLAERPELLESDAGFAAQARSLTSI